MTCTPRVTIRSEYSHRAAHSRGRASPILRRHPPSAPTAPTAPPPENPIQRRSRALQGHPQALDLRSGFPAQTDRVATPCRRQVQAVHKRLRLALARVFGSRNARSQQAVSSALHTGSTTQSITHCRVRLPQRRDRRQGMQNVAHGAKTDHEQTILGLGLQILILSQGWTAGNVAQPTCRDPPAPALFVLDF